MKKKTVQVVLVVAVVVMLSGLMEVFAAIPTKIQNQGRFFHWGSYV